VPENLLTVWGQLLFDSVAAAGVREVIISPGSRSTPFVLAAAAQPS
jgi:2-succinyl-5-enolpyruvyl-6-hydroxy-3-cyclohexene-1-carboxylate synthase